MSRSSVLAEIASQDVTAAEVDKLDGLTATTAELNYTDGVTSALQTQMDTKALIANTNMTGTATAVNITMSGDLTVNGSTTTLDTTNTVIEDNLIGLNNGASSNANDAGLIIERGSTGNDALFMWDESEDKWTLGTSTSTAASTGNLNMTVGTLVANLEGNVTGNVTGNTSGTAATVTTAAQSAITSVGTLTGLAVTQTSGAYGVNITQSGAAAGLAITQAATDYSALLIQNGVAPALYIDQNTNQSGIKILADSSSTNIIDVYDNNQQDTGGLMYLRSDSAETGTRNLVSIINDHVNAVNATALYIKQDSTAPALVAMGNVGIGDASPTEGKLTVKHDGSIPAIYAEASSGSSHNAINAASYGSSRAGYFYNESGGEAVRIHQTINQSALFIDQDGNADGIEVDQDGNGTGIEITNSGTGRGMQINNSNAEIGLLVSQDAASSGIYVDQNGNANAFHIDVASASGNRGIQLNHAGTGMGMEIANSNGGYGMLISQSGSANALYVDMNYADTAMVVDQQHAGQWTAVFQNNGDGYGVYIDAGHTSTTNPAFLIQNSAGRDLLKVLGNGSIITPGMAGANNTVLGSNAGNDLDSNSNNNTFIGSDVAGSTNITDADENVGLGRLALYDLTSGDYNTALGYAAGENITDALGNVIIGYHAGTGVVSGDYNVIVGYDVDTQVDATNSITLGQGVSATSNNIVIGKPSNIIYAGFTGTSTPQWVYTSDLRKKQDIKDDTLGLSFINDLKTKTFRWKPANEFPEEWEAWKEKEDGEREYDEMDTDTVMHGMVAQDVKAALDIAGVSTFGGWSVGDKGIQALAYGQFVMPLIKAVQELSAKVTALENA